MRIRIPIAVTLAAVMAVGSLGINTASAAPIAPPQKAVQFSNDQADVIRVASKKRRYRGNDAAAAAAFMGIVGGMIALSAQESRRDRYYNGGYYHDRGYGRHYYGGRNYGGRGYAYQPRRSYQGGGSGGLPYGSPDHRGAPQRAPDGGWYPQNAAPDAR